jgi:hypothetical protein
MKNWLWRIGIGVVGLLIFLLLARNFIARKSVELGVKRVTGFPLTIGTVDVGLFNGQLDVRDLKLMNPPEFEEKMFVDLPTFHLDYRLGSMIRGAPHIKEMFVDLNRLVIVKNAKGESNVSRLKGVTAAGGNGAGAGKSSQTKYRVDLLRVHVGTVTIQDFSRGTPSERNIPLNVNATYKDITDSTDINRLVLLTVMNQARLPEIGIKMDDLKKGLGNVQNLAGDAVKVAAEAGKGILDALKKAAPPK